MHIYHEISYTGNFSVLLYYYFESDFPSSGLQAVYRAALTIVELLAPRLMDLNDEGAMLPLLLRVPVDV